MRLAQVHLTRIWSMNSSSPSEPKQEMLPRLTMNTLKYQLHRSSFTFHNHLISTASVTNLIQLHIHNGNIKKARQLFDQNPTSHNTRTWNIIITAHIKHDQIKHANNLFNKMPLKDVVSWNTIMSGYTNTKDPCKVYQLFLQMNRAGETPNQFTFSTVISGFLNNTFVVLVPQLHGLVIQLGLRSNVFVGSALMRGYTRLKDCEALHCVFDDVVVKDVSTWNALVLGYMELGLINEAQMMFDEMPDVNIISWTTLVNGFIKNNRIDRARLIFDNMPEKNVVTWTAMIKGYVEYDNYVDAIELFMLMHRSGTCPNHFTLSTILDACAGCSTFLLGNQLHSRILKTGLHCEVVVLTALIDMYMKCGDIEAGFCVFECMENKNTVSWNSVIGGCARHGLAKRALCEFERMIESGVRPDNVTYINLLSACVHGGLVEEGERHFNSMGIRYGIKAEMKHYSCMVDLYGRSGEVEKAGKVVKEMPFEPDVGVWGALLAACGLHSCYEVASGLEKLACDHPTIYAMLVKVHGEKGEWGRAVEMRDKMMEAGARQQKAGSRTEFPHGVT